MNIRNIFFPGKWEIVITKKDPFCRSDFLDDFGDIVLRPGFRSYWADPFIVRDQERIFVFFEEYLLQERRGRIQCVEVNMDGTHTKPVTVITDVFHLSFPNVFRFEGSWYLVPETCKEKCIRLYKATKFPYRWEYVGNLMDDIDAVDCAFIQRDGIWFLMTSHPGAGGVDDRGSISVYYSYSPISLGSWKHHPQNPVVSNCQTGRNGGSVISRNTGVFRPAQNSESDYGKSLSIMKIDEISSISYSESFQFALTPNGTRFSNLHTLNNVNELWCYDRNRVSLKSIISRTIYRLYGFLLDRFGKRA